MPFIDAKQVRIDIINAVWAGRTLGKHIGAGCYLYRTVYYGIRDNKPVWV